jgi:ATP-dependent RNA helicase DHX8/PRP22
VRTTKQYAREACRIEPAWLPELAPAFFAAKAGAAAGAVEQRAGPGGGGAG